MSGANRKRGRPRIGVPKHRRDTDAGRIAAHLFDLFQQSGLSIDEVSEQSGISVSSLNYYFAAEKIPRVDKWRKLAAVLGLRRVNDLFPDMPIE